MRVTMIPIVIGAFGTVPKSLERRQRNRRTKPDHPDYNIIKIDQNTEENPGDLRRLAVPQTPEKKHQLTLM